MGDDVGGSAVFLIDRQGRTKVTTFIFILELIDVLRQYRPLLRLSWKRTIDVDPTQTKKEFLTAKMSETNELKAMSFPFKDPKFIFFTDFDGTITLKDSNDFMV